MHRTAATTRWCALSAWLMTIMLVVAGCRGDASVDGEDESMAMAPDDTSSSPPPDGSMDPMTPPDEDQPEDPQDPVEDPQEDPMDDPPEDDDEVITDSDIPNDGWIGGACASATECDFEGSICLSEADGFPNGQCSKACDRICPDRDGSNSVTFCVGSTDGGVCMARCDFGLFPDSGCRDDFVCRVKSRHTEPGTQVATGVPPSDMDTAMVSACMQEITEQGIGWGSWGYTPQTPADDPSLTCMVVDPIKADPVINGITYKYYNQSSGRPMYMGCDLAAALWDLGEVLKEYDITTVLHIGTFNCRKISGTSRLSQHGLGRAIDIWGFVDARGERYVLEDHWEHDTDMPRSEKARVIYEIGQRMHTDKIFHNVLTPNYNAGHDNHFHVDLKPGADFIGVQPFPTYYFGADEARWNELH